MKFFRQTKEVDEDKAIGVPRGFMCQCLAYPLFNVFFLTQPPHFLNIAHRLQT